MAALTPATNDSLHEAKISALQAQSAMQWSNLVMNAPNSTEEQKARVLELAFTHATAFAGFNTGLPKAAPVQVVNAAAVDADSGDDGRGEGNGGNSGNSGNGSGNSKSDKSDSDPSFSDVDDSYQISSGDEHVPPVLVTKDKAAAEAPFPTPAHAVAKSPVAAVTMATPVAAVVDIAGTPAIAKSPTVAIPVAAVVVGTAVVVVRDSPPCAAGSNRRRPDVASPTSARRSRGRASPEASTRARNMRKKKKVAYDVVSRGGGSFAGK
jgi:hypothetical protein